MAAFSDDDDLRAECPDLFTAGVASFDDQHTEAGKLIDRALELAWFRKEAQSRGVDWRDSDTDYDRDNLLSAETQLTRLAVYKVAELAARRLTGYHPDGDKWQTIREYYAKMYEAEFAAVVAFGLDYDWDESAAIDDDERFGQFPAELVRG